MAKKRLVLALGHDALGTNLPEQKAAVAKAAKTIADFIQNGWQVAITHGNTPQLGMIHTALNELAREHKEYTPAPMSVCSAMSQGYIGYDLQNAMRAELLKKGISKTASTILTQVLVDPYDDAFYHPVKVIGRYMTAEEADAEEQKGNYVIEEPGKGFRRIVAAPRPKDIIEIDAIRALLDADQVVIACGGGGIPVLSQGTELKGASAIIEKDFVSGKLAEMVNADVLLILTNEPHLNLHYNTERQEPIREITVEQAEAYIADNQFAKASKLPKVQASIDFVKAGEGRKAIITDLEHAKAALAGKEGTVITA